MPPLPPPAVPVAAAPQPPPVAPAPVAAARPEPAARRRLPIAAIAAVLALVAALGAVVAIVMVSTSRSSSPHVQLATTVAGAGATSGPTKTVTVTRSTTARAKSPAPPTSAAAAPSRLPRLISYAPGAYSVRVPVTWRRTADDVDHGAYRESKWESPARDASFLVDYTVGFSGTPRGGATQVRAQTSRAAGYQELRYGPWDGGAWRWDFVLSGQRKIDVFAVGCNTGYAALGAASTSHFTRLQPLFEQMARSLIPSCE